MVSMFLATLPAAVLHAQPVGGNMPTTSGGTASGVMRGVTTKDGEMNIEVNIWGFVRNPGKYSVPASTRLLDLISMAGGPTERAELQKVKVVHDKLVDSTITQLVRMIDVEEYQRTGDPAANPLLVPGDVIVIPGDTLNGFNQVLSVISNIAVVTISVVGLVFAFKSNK
ncbi:MAG TPA: SLBB domain-containing protein [Candidatus Kapabacteria bacterium]|nr:SLBB domain-containing protein [Candidatus Kapabacteria bacterium]